MSPVGVEKVRTKKDLKKFIRFPWPVNRFVASLGGKVYKKYRIYERNI